MRSQVGTKFISSSWKNKAALGMRGRAHVNLNNQGFITVVYLDYWIAKYDSAMQSMLHLSWSM